MAEYKCPDCQSPEITSTGKRIPGTLQSARIILCKNCGKLIGVVGDLTDMAETISKIAAKVGV